MKPVHFLCSCFSGTLKKLLVFFLREYCLALQFRYYRDLTKFKDVEDSEGISFLITLKPFGGTKTYGKSKIFGPDV